MTIYAYYKPGERVETLESHICRGLLFLDKIYIKWDYHLQVGRKLKLTPNEAERILITAYALHDLGKAYNPYQLSIQNGRGAPGHEVLSAYHAINLQNFNTEIIRSIALAIILHHHAMRKLSKSLKIILKNKYYSISNEDAKHVERILRKLNINISLEKHIESNIIVLKLFNLLRPILSITDDVSDQYTLAYCLLHPLVTCDILAASTSRVNLDKPVTLKHIINQLPLWVRDFIESRISNPFVGYKIIFNCY